MTESEDIFRQADRLVEKCGTRNTEQIAREIEIDIFEEDGFHGLLGIYTVRWSHRIILLNRLMEYYVRLMVIGHEIGHDARHRNLAKAEGMKEFSLFNMKDKTEYEAESHWGRFETTEKVGFCSNSSRETVELLHDFYA